MKFGIASGPVIIGNNDRFFWVKPNYKEFYGSGIPVTENVKEALLFDTKEEIERVLETLNYKFKDKPMVTSELEIKEV